MLDLFQLWVVVAKQNKIKIFGNTWTYRVFKRDQFKKRYPESTPETLAITYSNKNRIDFVTEGVTMRECRHEVIHAYIASLPLNSAELNEDALEEIYCELISREWNQIDSDARRIFNNLK